MVLSQYADESYAFELFRDGTAGLAYLLKDRIGEVGRLLEALREVSTGGSLIDPQVVDALVRGRARVRASALKDLTPRELDVLREMAAGRGNAGIAAHLHLSESSVEKHVNAIFTKLGLPAGGFLLRLQCLEGAGDRRVGGFLLADRHARCEFAGLRDHVLGGGAGLRSELRLRGLDLHALTAAPCGAAAVLN